MSVLTLYVDPPSYHGERDRLFDVEWARRTGGIDVLAPFVHLRDWLAERDVAVHTADLLPDEANGTSAFVSFGMRDRYRKLVDRSDVVLSAFFAFECPIVEPSMYRDLEPASRAFRRVYSYSTEEALKPFLTGRVPLHSFRIPQFFDEAHPTLFDRGDRDFLVMINGNKAPSVSYQELYTERLRALTYFERFREVDLYGIGWDGPVMRVGDSRLPGFARRWSYRAQRRWQKLRPPMDETSQAVRRSYRGPSSDKAETLSKYTFSLCFENMVLEGWITEKIFDCFYVGTIPVYLGAPDITDWVPAETFVDVRQFSGFEDLREFLRSLGPAEIAAYRDAARSYIESEAFYPFSKEAFAELVGGAVLEDAGVVV